MSYTPLTIAGTTLFQEICRLNGLDASWEQDWAREAYVLYQQELWDEVVNCTNAILLDLLHQRWHMKVKQFIIKKRHERNPSLPEYMQAMKEHYEFQYQALTVDIVTHRLKGNTL